MQTSHTKYTGATVQISWPTCWSIQQYFIKPHCMKMMTWLRKPKPTKGCQLTAEEDEW